MKIHSWYILLILIAFINVFNISVITYFVRLEYQGTFADGLIMWILSSLIITIFLLLPMFLLKKDSLRLLGIGFCYLIGVPLMIVSVYLFGKMFNDIYQNPELMETTIFLTLITLFFAGLVASLTGLKSWKEIKQVNKLEQISKEIKV
ncbi:hypothetical protein JW868_01855 [Candidatus Woesearchaeota archaeon]|nr:hypothetical protein [Candidatus Woesearchaeota archaeon]